MKGLVRAVGVSNYGPKQLLKIHSYLEARRVPLCSAQVLLLTLVCYQYWSQYHRYPLSLAVDNPGGGPYVFQINIMLR